MQTAPHTTRRRAFFPLRCDMRQGSPRPALYTGEEDAPQQHENEGPIRCRFCLLPVTDRSLRAVKKDRFAHYCTNPAGITFQIGIFLRAPGCSVIGPAEERYSWFEGYAWRTAYCGNCGTHLGWRFESAGNDSFFGLILPHLAGV